MANVTVRIVGGGVRQMASVSTVADVKRGLGLERCDAIIRGKFAADNTQLNEGDTVVLALRPQADRRGLTPEEEIARTTEAARLVVLARACFERLRHLGKQHAYELLVEEVQHETDWQKLEGLRAAFNEVIDLQLIQVDINEGQSVTPTDDSE